MKNISYVIILLLFLGCTPKPSDQLHSISYGNYTESSFEDIPSWEDENFSEALSLFAKTCEHVETKELFKVVCAKVKTATSPRTFFETNFTPFTTLSKKAFVSGYYEPLLYGSLKKSKLFSNPVYAVPNDLLHVELLSTNQKDFSKPIRGRLVNKNVKPYFSREAIDKGAIKSKPICYVDDKIDLYFMQEYGSGRIVLKNKKQIYLGYADYNGHPYHAIEDELPTRKIFKEKTLTPRKMRDYLRQHPAKQDEIFQTNAAYTFFKKYTSEEVGSLGMVLSAKQSVAVDNKNIPLGMPIFMSMKKPLGETSINTIMFAHDTQKELKGDAQIKVFYGTGKTAQKEAEATHETLKFWILVPNDYLHHDYLLKSKYL